MMPFLPPFFHLLSFIYFLNAKTVEFIRYRYWFLYRGAFTYLISCLSLSSFVSIGDPYLFGAIRKYFIISVFAIQYGWIFHNIYMPLLLSFFSGDLVEYSNGRFFFFFVLTSAFMNENKRKESLIMIWISFLWVASFFFNFILILLLLLDLQAISYITIIRYKDRKSVV